MGSQMESMHSAVDSMGDDDVEYFAGLIDAQLAIVPSKAGGIRVLLTCNEPRVAEEIRVKFEFTRITTVMRPNKKDVCTCLFIGKQAETLLEFAATHCVIKKDLAAKALDVERGAAPVEDLAALVERVPADDELSLDCVSGYFDVKSIVVRPSPPCAEKRVRGSVKIVLPKSETFLIPALQKVISGKVKKTSPCRLVFESKDSIAALVDMVSDRVRVKRRDLQAL